MTDTTNTVIDTAVQTAAAMAPAIIAAAAPGSNAATVVALAPVALQMLQTATQLQQAGLMSPEQLASLFATIGQGIQATHAKWAAMNAQSAALAPATMQEPAQSYTVNP